MLYEDEDDIFMGTPRSKFFDIVFNANRNLVEHKIETLFERYIAMEKMLEDQLGEEVDVQRIVDSWIIENPDEVHARKKDMFIVTVGDILTQNE